MSAHTNDAVDRAELLRELGYGHPEAQVAAIEVLIAAGLTNARKKGIAAYKREQCREVLSAQLERLCERCNRATANSSRQRVPVGQPRDCERCHGSPNLLAVETAARQLRQQGMSHLLIVGGAPKIHQELRALWPDDLQLRIVDGDSRHNGAVARAQLAWADVAIVVGGSILPHTISLLYTSVIGPKSVKVIQVRRGGVEAIANELVDHLKKRKS